MPGKQQSPRPARQLRPLNTGEAGTRATIRGAGAELLP
jgi:hypothetical protein